jgi:hypothetical protein
MNAKLNLDVSKLTDIVQTVYVGAGDHNGTTLDVTVTDWGIPADLTGTTTSVEMRLSDGSALSVPCAIVAPNRASATIDAQDLDGLQVYFAYLAIVDGDRMYSTERFEIVTVPGNNA